MAKYFGYNPARNAVNNAADEELYHLGPSHDLKAADPDLPIHSFRLTAALQKRRLHRLHHVALIRETGNIIEGRRMSTQSNHDYRMIGKWATCISAEAMGIPECSPWPLRCMCRSSEIKGTES